MDFNNPKDFNVSFILPDSTNINKFMNALFSSGFSWHTNHRIWIDEVTVDINNLLEVLKDENKDN